MIAGFYTLINFLIELKIVHLENNFTLILTFLDSQLKNPHPFRCHHTVYRALVHYIFKII